MIAALTACTIDDTPPVVECTPTPLAEPVAGWRFQTDPDLKGESAGWANPNYDDSKWRADIAPGSAWEQQGLDFDGAGWFRAEVALPDEPRVIMVVSGADDTAQVWVDGGSIAMLDSALHILDLSVWRGKTVSIAVRVNDGGGYGGLKDAVRIGGDEGEVLTRSQWAAWLAKQNPGWPLPGWTRGGPAAWAMTGALNSADEALVSSEGRIAPWATAPTAMAMLLDMNGISPVPAFEPPTFGLVGEHLPLPRWEQKANGAILRQTLFFDETDKAVRWLVDVDNAGSATPYRLLIVVTGFAANQTTHAITAASAANPSRLWVNGQPYVAAATAPDQAGAGRIDAILNETALAGPITAEKTLGCAPDGDGAAILSYTIPSGQSRSLAFAFPANSGGDFPSPADAGARLAEATALWEDQTSRVKVALPDGRVQGAFQASTGTLLLALDPDGPHPGPLAHDSLWVRDGTYIGLALLQTGHADAVKAYLPAIWAGQSEDGRVPPITGKSIPWDDDEWDAQGEAIYLTVATARYTSDTELLKQYYPHIKKSVAFITALRERNTSSGAAKGLLPPSLSAEDLGPQAAHYYWDDFWAVIGLEAAADAADLLGKTADARQFRAEADDLRAAILASVESVMGADPAYIPGSVEDTVSSSAARGSVPALWPGDALPADDPLMARSFDHYHKTWIEPYGGGFLHRDGQFWPVGGLELAHAYMALGRGDVLHQILGWTLSHQTLPGTYAWADEVSPQHNGVAGGDMPHAWVAASYVTLVRQMLIREQGDTIHLFTLAPEGWFGSGGVISVNGAPTWFGPLDITTESTVQDQDGNWAGTLTLTLSGATPPGGFIWTMPKPPSRVDGPDGTVYEDGRLLIPEAGVVTLTFGE